MAIMHGAKGVSLLELLAVLIITGILALVGVRAVTNTQNLNLDEARLAILSALHLAQSRALSTMATVRVSIASNALSIHVDSDGNSVFTSGEAITNAGQSFPLTVPADVSISSVTLIFDTSGRTNATQITLTQAAQSRVIAVSSTGYAQ
jgi:prepilin-type N-terminal cleavage/methylation domain-containing protein